jgi:HK97 family phage major capsid protein
MSFQIEEIEAIAKRLESRVDNHALQQLKNRAIAGSLSLDAYRESCMALLPSVQPVRTAKPLAVKPSEWKNYSLARAILAQIDGGHSVDSAFEREISQECAIQQRSKPQGLFIPPEVFSRNFVAGTGTLGGMIVETSNLGDQFIELLRNKAKVLQLGARVLNLDNPVTIPRQNAAGSTNWVGETVAATLSTGNFTQITLTPNAVSAFQQYSKQLLATNNPSIDSLIRNDILQELGLAVDLAALHGTGSGQPTGIAGTTGIGTVELAANGQALANTTAYPAMVSLETSIAGNNADVGSMAYLMRAGHRAGLKTVQRFSSTDSPVYETRRSDAGELSGSVNGYRAEVSQQISTTLTTGTATTICSAIFFGVWSECIVAQFAGGNTDLVVDPYTLAVNGVVRIIARRWVDIGVRHPASFAVLGGVLTT